MDQLLLDIEAGQETIESGLGSGHAPAGAESAEFLAGRLAQYRADLLADCAFCAEADENPDGSTYLAAARVDPEDLGAGFEHRPRRAPEGRAGVAVWCDSTGLRLAWEDSHAAN